MKHSFFRKLGKCGATALLALLALGGGAHATEVPKSESYGGDYRIPLDAEPTSLDPAFITSIYAVNVAMNLFDGLVAFDEDLNVVPAIARIWKISRDHRTYTFFLRNGVRFHNGREVSAKDFVFSLGRILSPSLQSPAASLFLHIKGAKAFHEGKKKTIAGLRAIDQYTLEIELERPFAPFLSILAMANAKVVSEEAIGPDFARRPVGTGPFRFGAWEPGKEILLTANHDYYGGQPFLGALHFRIYPNIVWEKIFEDFQKGQLEQSIIPSSKYNMIRADPRYSRDYNFITKPSLNLVYLGINMAAPPFSDYRVRQAVSYAVDTQTIVTEITRRGSVPAKGVLPPGIAGFDPKFEGYPYDPEKARRLLKEAGYPGGQGIPPIEVWTVSKAESVQKELEAYQAYLAEIGIKLVPKVAANWKEFVHLIDEKRVPMYYAAWYADYPDPDNFLYVLFHSKSKTNRMGYQNAGVDELLEQARSETDYLKRIDIYRNVQKQVMREAPIICQHVNSFNYLFQPWVRGVRVSFLGAAYIPFNKVWIDHQSLSGDNSPP